MVRKTKKAKLNTGKGKSFYLTSAIRPAPKVDLRYGLTGDTWADGGMWIGVKSTDVGAIMYHKKRRELYVEFRASGKIYSYSPVTQNVAEDFFNVNSMGRFVWYRLRPFFSARKVIMIIPVGAKRFTSTTT